MHLQGSIQERSQSDLWSGGNGSRLTCGGQDRSNGPLRSRLSSPIKWRVHQPEELNTTLFPIVDNGFIRVGGRLAHRYSMTDNQRFPLLVSHRSKPATLAINNAHMRTLHGGPQHQWQN